MGRAPLRNLDEYNAKRRFELTSEPRGVRVRASRETRSQPRRFVVQQHDATRMHFDFRLELDGVMLSWAVPKGPSLSPADKRLAVQTEDHPLDYRNFEGIIADGQYGAGPVIVWDHGHWQPETDPHQGLVQGKLKFMLEGEKLHGSFALVRTRGTVREGPKSNWLLIKHADEAARSGVEAQITRRLPESVLSGRTVEQVAQGAVCEAPPRKRSANVLKSTRTKPKQRASLLPLVEVQLATAADRPPVSGDWIYEIKFDGYRMLARLKGSDVKLCSRNARDWTARFPGIADALARLDLEATILDGEICFVDDEGRTRFGGLQAILGNDAEASKTPAAKSLQASVRFFVFDVLFDRGEDVRALPLRARKQRLRALLDHKPTSSLVYSDDVVADGRMAFTQACAAGLEGLIAKRADAPYRGGRGTSWLKLKCHRRQEFAIVGLTAPAGSRTDLGALLLAVREGSKWVYRGKVGTGFSQGTLKELGQGLRALRIDQSVLDSPPRMAGVTWVQPRMVCEVEFSEATSDGRLRHPVFLGIRQDKKAREISDEKVVRIETTKTSEKPDRLEIQGVSISHAERMVDRRSGLTKGELAQYFDSIHGLLMPYAAGRPVALARCPDGDAQACFFQKHKGPGMGAQVHSVRVEGQEALYFDDVRGLMQLVQFNAVEFHGWGSRVNDAGRPDRLVVDLDPDVSLDFADVVQAAFEVREALARIGLKTFVKTTGGKGLHVVAPLTPAANWDQAKQFAHGMAAALAKIAPDRYVATMSKAKRRGRIFIDYLRNARGATAVLPYSPRARPGAPVAMPLDWKQVASIHPQEFSVRSAARWISKRRQDPWKDFFSLDQRLPTLAPLP